MRAEPHFQHYCRTDQNNQRQHRRGAGIKFYDDQWRIPDRFSRNRSLYYTTMDDGVLITSEEIDKNLSWTEVPENHFIIASNPSQVELCAYDVHADSQVFRQFQFNS